MIGSVTLKHRKRERERVQERRRARGGQPGKISNVFFFVFIKYIFGKKGLTRKF